MTYEGIHRVARNPPARGSRPPLAKQSTLAPFATPPPLPTYARCASPVAQRPAQVRKIKIPRIQSREDAKHQPTNTNPSGKESPCRNQTRQRQRPGRPPSFLRIHFVHVEAACNLTPPASSARPAPSLRACPCMHHLHAPYSIDALRASSCEEAVERWRHTTRMRGKGSPSPTRPHHAPSRLYSFQIIRGLFRNPTPTI